MNKTIIIFIILAVAIASAAYFIFQNPGEGGKGETTVGYFKNELEREVVKKIGQPIEGVSAFILMNAFPKFVAEDFEGIETLEGTYTVTGGELQFVRAKEQPITSAEQMIAEGGYSSLLQNVSTRLNIKIENTQSVDVVLDILKDTPVQDQNVTTGSIRGRVLLGPQCPVVREGDESCNDKPYQTTVRIREEGETRALTAQADEQGRFVIEVPAGAYSVSAVGKNPFPACAEKQVEVVVGQDVNINLLCDTGIR